MANRTWYPSVYDMATAQNFANQQGTYNLMGGNLNAMLQAKQQQAQQQASQQLQNFLTMNQQYGGALSPPPSVNAATNTMFGSPWQQFRGNMGFPSTQPGILPQQPQNMVQAQSGVNLMNYLTGQGVQPESASHYVFGSPMTKVGQLTPEQYTALNQDLGNVAQSVDELKKYAASKGQNISDDDVKKKLYAYYISKYGVNQRNAIKQALWPMGTGSDIQALLAQIEAQIQSQVNK